MQEPFLYLDEVISKAGPVGRAPKGARDASEKKLGKQATAALNKRPPARITNPKPTSFGPSARAPKTTANPSAPTTAPKVNWTKQQKEELRTEPKPIDCIYGGGEECRKHGGNEAKTHMPGSKSAINHAKAKAEELANAKKDEPTPEDQAAVEEQAQEPKVSDTQTPEQQVVSSGDKNPGLVSSTEAKKNQVTKKEVNASKIEEAKRKRSKDSAANASAFSYEILPAEEGDEGVWVKDKKTGFEYDITDDSVIPTEYTTLEQVHNDPKNILKEWTGDKEGDHGQEHRIAREIMRWKMGQRLDPEKAKKQEKKVEASKKEEAKATKEQMDQEKHEANLEKIKAQTDKIKAETGQSGKKTSTPKKKTESKKKTSSPKKTESKKKKTPAVKRAVDPEPKDKKSPYKKVTKKDKEGTQGAFRFGEKKKPPKPKTKKQIADENLDSRMKADQEAFKESFGKKEKSPQLSLDLGDDARSKVAASQKDKVAEKKKKLAEGSADSPPKGPKDNKGSKGEGTGSGKAAAKKKKLTISNLRERFNAGRVAGTRVGEAAADAQAGGYLLSAGVEYGVGGAIAAGQNLLRPGNRTTTSAPKKTTSRKKPTTGAEVEQSSMKSLPIYLDLQKAIQMPNAGGSTPDDKRARAQHISSYAKQPVGVANEGIVKEDDPDKGKRWAKDDDNSVQAEVDNELAVKKKDEEEEEEVKVNKAIHMLKSLNSGIREEVSKSVPNSLEASFMVEELGYDPLRVSKGLMFIKGRDRHRFNEWAHNRLSKSIASLAEVSGLTHE